MPQLSTVHDVEVEIKNLYDRDFATLEKIDKLDDAMIQMRQKFDDASKRTDGLEVKLNERIRWGGGSSLGQEQIADVLMQQPGFHSALTLKSGDKLDFAIRTKDILGLGVQLPQPTAIAGGPSLMYQVQSLIPSIETRSGAISFLRETSFTDNADVVAEGAPKPKSEKTFTKVTVPVETFAHYFKVSKQSYEDTAGLAAEIEANLFDGLNRKVEQQILFGNGTSPQLIGLYPVVPAATVPAGTPTIIDTLISAVTELAAKGYRASAIVMSPADVGAMSLLKDSTGRYLLNALPPMPRIVVSPILAAGQWILGDFAKARIVMREESSIQVAAQHETDFVHNMLTVLGETRLGLVTYQAAAFLKAPVAPGMESEMPKARQK